MNPNAKPFVMPSMPTRLPTIPKMIDSEEDLENEVKDIKEKSSKKRKIN